MKYLKGRFRHALDKSYTRHRNKLIIYWNTALKSAKAVKLDEGINSKNLIDQLVVRLVDSGITLHSSDLQLLNAEYIKLGDIIIGSLMDELYTELLSGNSLHGYFYRLYNDGILLGLVKEQLLGKIRSKEVLNLLTYYQQGNVSHKQILGLLKLANKDVITKKDLKGVFVKSSKDSLIKYDSGKLYKFLKWFKFKYLRKKGLSFNDFYYENSGAYGVIVDLGNGLVLKVETLTIGSNNLDIKYRFLNDLTLKGINGVVNIFDVYKLGKELYGKEYLVTIMEKVDCKSGKVQSLLATLSSDLKWLNQDEGLSNSTIVNKRPMYLLFELLAKHQKSLEAIFEKNGYYYYFSNDDISLLKKLFYIVENIYAYGIMWEDIKSDQFCVDGVGNLIATDVDNLKYFKND